MGLANFGGRLESKTLEKGTLWEIMSDDLLEGALSFKRGFLELGLDASMLGGRGSVNRA